MYYLPYSEEILYKVFNLIFEPNNRLYYSYIHASNIVFMDELFLYYIHDVLLSRLDPSYVSKLSPLYDQVSPIINKLIIDLNISPDVIKYNGGMNQLIDNYIFTCLLILARTSSEGSTLFPPNMFPPEMSNLVLKFQGSHGFLSIEDFLKLYLLTDPTSRDFFFSLLEVNIYHGVVTLPQELSITADTYLNPPVNN